MKTVLLSVTEFKLREEKLVTEDRDLDYVLPKMSF